MMVNEITCAYPTSSLIADPYQKRDNCAEKVLRVYRENKRDPDHSSNACGNLSIIHSTIRRIFLSMEACVRMSTGTGRQISQILRIRSTEDRPSVTVYRLQHVPPWIALSLI